MQAKEAWIVSALPCAFLAQAINQMKSHLLLV